MEYTPRNSFEKNIGFPTQVGDMEIERMERIHRAKELLVQMEGYDGKTIVGARALEEVEGVARELTELLDGIEISTKIANSLPYSPRELMPVHDNGGLPVSQVA